VTWVCLGLVDTWTERIVRRPKEAVVFPPGTLAYH
jgi:hypothetical protein